MVYIFLMAQQPPGGQGLLLVEASPSHSDTNTLCSTPLDERSALRRGLYLITQHKQETYIHAPAGIRTRVVSKRAAT